ncbi:M12 family metallopeptidase [Haloarcula sp. 1CSR25-25]|uniref:M12 family metallopeptidase n=1 Tax=Haloarcula sp. 1CSR25-25 TaxID=2862545 RepID=UPI002895DA8D|nr:M12 family metallopeptidase [Haloarcula sp. 1CSR25-25]MDT3433286.1 M12 family metallopeptidase [Haloarcula sp. 1CSR25-25]
MDTEKFNPNGDVQQLKEVRIDIPGIGPQRKTAEIIDGMAVVEGDIVLGPAEEFTDVEAADSPDGAVDSIGLTDDSALWPDATIPYEIESGFPRESRIHDAIDHWEANTPVTFVPRSGHSDYVRFFDGSGCWSYVGRQGGQQEISIDTGCGTGAVIHEIAHAAGIWHEQSRSDRDVYVTINWENIRESQKHNFKKHTDSNDIGRYDYGSIMHYGPYAFSNGGGKTIEAPEPIGNRSGLSEGDIDAIFRLYGPSDAGAADGVTDDWETISFDSDVDPEPVVLADVQTYNGGNTVGVRMRNRGDGTAEVFLEEEQSGDSETRHTEEAVGFFATDEGTIVDERATPIGEAGVVTTDQSSATQWHTVALDGTYSDPVVFMQLMSYNGEHPAHMRVRDVSPGSFKFQIEEWRYLNDVHTTEDVGYVVLESGTHRLRNGLELTVGSVETDHDWATESPGLLSNPVVLSQCQTVNGSQPVVTRHRDVGKREFDVRLQEEEAGNRHRTETIGYMGISRPETFEYGIALDDVTDEWRQLDYEGDFQSTPATVASITTFNGGNTASVRMKDPGPRKASFRVEEAQSADDETAHIEEQVAYIATPEGPVYYAAGKQLGEAGVVTRDQAGASQWHTIPLEEDYAHRDPVVLTQLLSESGGHPAHTRVRNVGATAFEFQIEEWEYLNERHVDEQIGYVVLPSGLYPLPDGGLLEVGTTQTNHSWTSVALDSQLQDGEGNVAVVSRCQSYNGPQAVVTRHRNVSPSGFDVRLQEEEANGRHRTETIGYAAAIHDA